MGRFSVANLCQAVKGHTTEARRVAASVHNVAAVYCPTCNRAWLPIERPGRDPYMFEVSLTGGAWSLVPLPQ